MSDQPPRMRLLIRTSPGTTVQTSGEPELFESSDGRNICIAIKKEKELLGYVAVPVEMLVKPVEMLLAGRRLKSFREGVA